MDRIAAPRVSAGKEKGAGAALIQAGLCIAGDDIVVNRLMGRFQFVPAEEDDEATKTGTGHSTGRAALTPAGSRRRFGSGRLRRVYPGMTLCRDDGRFAGEDRRDR